VQKFSRRAREYMAAYFILSLEGVEMDKGDNSRMTMYSQVEN